MEEFSSYELCQQEMVELEKVIIDDRPHSITISFLKFGTILKNARFEYKILNKVSIFFSYLPLIPT